MSEDIDYVARKMLFEVFGALSSSVGMSQSLLQNEAGTSPYEPAKTTTGDSVKLRAVSSNCRNNRSAFKIVDANVCYEYVLCSAWKLF
jgi:hypothetical protein